MKIAILSFFVFAINFALIGQQKQSPSFEEIISVQNVSGANISPDGRHVIFQKSSADWEENSFDRELFLSRDGGEAFQITNNADGSSGNAKWSPDSKWIAFTSNRGNKNQVYVIRADGGEAIQVSQGEQSILDFEWSPDGSEIAFLQSMDISEKENAKEGLYGGFSVEDQEFALTELWKMPFDPERILYKPLPSEAKDSSFTAQLAPQKVIDSLAFSISDFAWSPDGKKIAIGHQPDPMLLSFMKSDISVIDLESKEVDLLVSNPSSDQFLDWSPDSRSIVYQSNLDDSTSNFYTNNNYFRIDIDGSNEVQLATSFDENINGIEWSKKGIYGVAWQKTKRSLLQIDPDGGDCILLDLGLERLYGYSLSDDASKIAFNGINDDNLGEVYISSFPEIVPKQITNSSRQIENWSMSDSEVITWKSEDGATIEGVLHKPENYDPEVKYPLLVVIHGGPTGISVPNSGIAYVYPVVQWLNKGALVLMPNYRGSAGYGAKFRSLNVENLGVGDAWDVLSGVKYLEDEGVIDGDKVASMGWSQGGYISAFLTTNSNKFKAISVGAGISNWMTYYVNTDIHPFTRQYLKATPWSNPEVYAKTSPMTKINDAVTPTLIQHGEFDRRVPIANAYELFQGLQDVGVETKLIVYKGFGHGITKPKERLAAMWHNWQWFGKYLWDEDIEMPME